MDLNVLLYIAAIVISMIVGLVVIPQVLRLCKKRGLYDLPNERKVHSNAVPRLGGVSFVPALVISVGCLIGLMNPLAQGFRFDTWVVLLLCGLMIMYLIGLADDLVGISAQGKFLVQILCGIAFPLSGLVINNLYGFCGIYELSAWISWPLTVFIAVFTMNAVNLIDGIDGLAGCISLLAALIFGFLFIHTNLPVYALCSFALVGALLAFLRFNLGGNPSKNTKIFMGDTGSLTLGYVLTFFCIRYAMDDKEVMPYRENALLVAFSILAVPAMDVLRVVLLRLRTHVPLFKPDKNHIHHKFMRAGCSPKFALLYIMSIALGFCVLNFCLMRIMPSSLVVLIDVICWVILHLYLDYKIQKTTGQSNSFFGKK
jgi:UDP-N-acetylmuramyl pentapeptide phosphotransferase/UDP-N-acetylglucosamine-1-phosphate transferase